MTAGLFVPVETGVQVGFESEGVDCRINPGPFDQEMVRFVLVKEVTLSEG